jgi:ribosomal protein L7/L12
MMTLAQLEERVTALEEAFSEWSRSQQNVDKSAGEAPQHEIIPGTECPIILSKPAVETIRCEAVVKWVREASQELGLSEADWAGLGLEEDDE